MNDLTGPIIMIVICFGIGGYTSFTAWLAPEKLKQQFDRARAQMDKRDLNFPILEFSSRPQLVIWMWRFVGPIFLLAGLVPAAVIIEAILH
jgi:hypothetical protein